ncbi:MAG: Hsp33 family molecular chaperone HslO [Clostridia bacterium]|nr:Hsp33 family molecular chaperone HslO [Clostridia bacterium]
MQDMILRGMLCSHAIRFTAISGKEMVRDAQRTHTLSRVATAALGRQLLMTSMIASDLKNPGDTLTTVLAGNGPAGNLVCVGRYGGFVKGYATEPDIELPLRADGKLDVGGYVGRSGKLTLIRDLGLKEPYVGMCNLVSGEVAEDFAQYFTASEQQPSLVYLGVREQAESGEVLGAGGIWIQPMPDCGEEAIAAVEAAAPKIAQLTALLSDGNSLEDALKALLDTLEPEITERMEPAYLCDCSRERLERALLSIGEEELNDILEHEGEAELTCQFCGKRYRFDRAALTALLESAKG